MRIFQAAQWVFIPLSQVIEGVSFTSSKGLKAFDLVLDNQFNFHQLLFIHERFIQFSA